MELAPLKPAANKLYSVRLDERFYYSHIEAPSAAEAIAKAEASYPKYKGKTIDCTAENIYEAGIGLSDEDGQTENGIFEISIRGCDPERVQRLKMAIVKYLGAPYIDYDEIGKIDPLLKSLCGLCVEGY